MHTPASDLVGVDVPIFGFSHCRDVVAAVTNAGGCGVLGAVAHSPKQLDIDLTWIEQEVKGKPYGVDLLVPEKFAGAEEGGLDRDALRNLVPEAHRAFVDDLLARYGVPPAPEDESAGSHAIGGMRVDPKSMAPLLDVLFAHETRLVASALGPPPAHFIERAHDAGIPVAALAGSVEHARKHADAGADLIVAQGTEAGGHTGLIATMVLVPEVVDAVDVPVLAAGGIARGRQLAAGMALGADGVWCGSVWLTTEEAETPPVVKEKFLRAGLGDTVRSRSLTGKPARMLRTPWTEEWERADGPGPLPMPIQPLLISDAMYRIHRVAAKEGTGANDLVTYFVGQVVGSMNTVRPTKRVVLEMVEEFIDTVERLHGLVSE